MDKGKISELLITVEPRFKSHLGDKLFMLSINNNLKCRLCQIQTENCCCGHLNIFITNTGLKVFLFNPFYIFTFISRYMGKKLEKETNERVSLSP